MSFSFTRKGVVHNPITHWDLSDGNVLLMYQGSRGANPDLDFIVKYKSPGKKLRTPSHTHWIVDLLAKSQHAPDEICSFVSDWIDLYDKIEPFTTNEERDNYQFVYNEYFCDEYDNLNNLGYFSIEFLSCLLELFVKCEKQTPNAFMFKNLLQLVKDFCSGKRDYYQVISYSKRV